MNVHPDDDADEDDLDDTLHDDAAAPQPPSTPTRAATRPAVPTTPPTQTAPPPQRLVDLSDDGIVALAESDALALAGVTVLLPDACWPEWNDTSSSTMCTILGPLASDSSL